MVLSKIKESVLSTLPIAIIVAVLSFTLAPLPLRHLGSFLIGCVLVIAGMTLFSVGAEVAMIPIGNTVGSATTKTRNLPLIIAIALLIGVIITIAEPDLSVLASGLSPAINKWLLIALVAIGVGVFLALSMLRVIFGIQLRLLLLISYGVVFALALVLSLLGKEAFLPLSFDSGGVTTGPMTVPFIIAMGVGVSAISGKSGTDESFGFVALSSIGPLISVMLLGLFSDVSSIRVAATEVPSSLLRLYGATFLEQMKDMAIAIGPIAVFFLIFRFTANKNMPATAFWRIVFGLIYTYVGLVVFMTGAHAGFSSIGEEIGRRIAENYKYALIPLGVLIGFLIVAAEPAVHVLNNQIEAISGGTIKKTYVLFTLMGGVALAVGLAMIRVLFTFSIWWLILPGYALALLLSFFTPKTYTAIAFDSGGVASGPMTATFLLPLATGACASLNGEEGIIRYAYGLVAMVAMAPLIVLQALGLVMTLRAKKAEKAMEKAAPSLSEEIPVTVEELPMSPVEDEKEGLREETPEKEQTAQEKNDAAQEKNDAAQEKSDAASEIIDLD